MNDTKKVLTIAGLMAGGIVIGAGLGLLLAPQPGWMSRQRFRDCAARAQSEASDLAQRIKSRAESTAEKNSASFSREEAEPVYAGSHPS